MYLQGLPTGRQALQVDGFAGFAEAVLRERVFLASVPRQSFSHL